MKKAAKTLEFILEQTIPASPAKVFEAWFDPKKPDNIWSHVEKLIFEPKVDGFFYMRTSNQYAVYGRFIQIERPNRIQHTWVSPITLGMETMVTVAFTKKGKGTLMALSHSGLPDGKSAREHEKGWAYFLNKLAKNFGSGARSH